MEINVRAHAKYETFNQIFKHNLYLH